MWGVVGGGCRARGGRMEGGVGVIECGLVLVEFLGGLVVIEMVGGCRIGGGGGLTHVFVHTVNIIFTLCILFINVD